MRTGDRKCRAAGIASVLTIGVSCDPRMTSISLSDWEKIKEYYYVTRLIHSHIIHSPKPLYDASSSRNSWDHKKSKYLVFGLYREYVPIPALGTLCSFIKSLLKEFEEASWLHV